MGFASDKVDDFELDLHRHQNAAVNQSTVFASSTLLKIMPRCYGTKAPGMAAWLPPKRHNNRTPIRWTADGGLAFVISGGQTSENYPSILHLRHTLSRQEMI